MGDQCKSELKQLRQISCTCREQIQPQMDQAQSDCTTDANRDAIQRMTQRAGGVAKQANVGCDSTGPAEHAELSQPPSPFCPRPEGEAKGGFAKSHVALNGQARLGVAAKTGGQ
jgi:hypothetical protein